MLRYLDKSRSGLNLIHYIYILVVKSSAMLHFCASMYLWASEQWRKNQSSNNKIEVNKYKAVKVQVLKHCVHSNHNLYEVMGFLLYPI